MADEIVGLLRVTLVVCPSDAGGQTPTRSWYLPLSARRQSQQVAETGERSPLCCEPQEPCLVFLQAPSGWSPMVFQARPATRGHHRDVGKHITLGGNTFARTEMTPWEACGSQRRSIDQITEYGLSTHILVNSCVVPGLRVTVPDFRKSDLPSG